MTKKVIDARQVLDDIHGGMSDTSLMEAYGLSSKGLQSLFQKLVSAELLTQDEVDDRAPLSERTVKLEVHRCPACNMPQLFEFAVCPQCGVIVSKFRKKQEPDTGAEDSGSVERGDRQRGVGNSLPVSTKTAVAPSVAPEISAAPALSRVLWQFKTQGQIVASAASYNDLICFGSLDANLYCLDLETGRERWQFAVDDPVRASPAIAKGMVYVGTLGGTFYAVHADTGREKWRADAFSAIHTGAIVYQGLVYVGTANGTVFAWDGDTGKENARFELGKSISGSPVISGGKILVGCTDGCLYAIG